MQECSLVLLHWKCWMGLMLLHLRTLHLSCCHEIAEWFGQTFFGNQELSGLSITLSLWQHQRGLVMSVNMAYSSRSCSMHFYCTCLFAKTMSTVLSPGWNPYHVSRRFASETLTMSHFRTMQAIIIPVMDRCDIPLYLPQLALLTLFL